MTSGKRRLNEENWRLCNYGVKLAPAQANTVNPLVSHGVDGDLGMQTIVNDSTTAGDP